MATYNPAMLKDEPFGKDWKAAPDLTSFAADYAGAGAGASSAGGAYGGSATTGTGSSASVGAAGSSASGDAASAGNGAGTCFSHLTNSHETDVGVDADDIQDVRDPLHCLPPWLRSVSEHF
jgi:hypothetical protein